MNEPKPNLYVKDIDGNCHRYEQEQGEPVIGTKTWFEDGKVVTQNLYYSDVYTTPQQRTWVGLTDDEMHECAQNNMRIGEFRFLGFYKDIEKLLKEKNT